MHSDFDIFGNGGIILECGDNIEEINTQSRQRTTLDQQWEEDELIDDIYDVCNEVMTDELLAKYKGRALFDYSLLLVPYMAEEITGSIDDVIELYNKEYDKHRNIANTENGISFYDDAIKKMILSKLKGNLVNK